MSELSKEELIKLYNEMPEDTLKKLGVYKDAKKAYEEKQEMERLKQQRLEKAKALVEEAQELLDRYKLELKVTKQGIRFIDRDGRTVLSDSQKKREAGGRLPQGIKTPASQYRIPILQSLVELGGRAQKKIVMELVYEKMKDDFVQEDLEKLSGGQTRWFNTASRFRETIRRTDSLV